MILADTFLISGKGSSRMPTTTILEELDKPLALNDDQTSQFNRDGFIKLKNVFSAELLAYYGDAITNYVLAHNDLTEVPMDQRDTYQKAFIQVMNLWLEDEIAKEFVLGKRLARIASELLGTSGVRLYHDQALYKEPSGGFTPWHADQQYWPLATDRCITAWVPLMPVPLEMGPLSFAAASHALDYGRDLEISDDSEEKLANTLEESGFPFVQEAFKLGEVSFHLGWTYHRAGPNTTADVRRIMTVIYMDELMELKRPENPNQQRDWDTWCPGARIGQVIDTPLNPVIYSRSIGSAELNGS